MVREQLMPLIDEVFQSAPLREGRCNRRFSLRKEAPCFNPRPYVRGDDSKEKLNSWLNGPVSIRAPT